MGEVSSRLQSQDRFCTAVDNNEKLDVSVMLEEGCDPNTSSDYDHRYMTALERAVESGHLKMTALLLAHGADPTCNVYKGEMPMHGGFVDVRPGFEAAFKQDAPIREFAGLYALAIRLDGTIDHRVRWLLRLVEARRACEMPAVFGNLRILGEAGAHIRRAADVALLCVQRHTPLFGLLTRHVMTTVVCDGVDAALRAFAQTADWSEGSEEDEAVVDEGGAAAADESLAPWEGVLQEVAHEEPAAVIHPVEASQIVAVTWADFVERYLASAWVDRKGEEYEDVFLLHFNRVSRPMVDRKSVV